VRGERLGPYERATEEVRVMFQPNTVVAALPAQDFERAKSFYADKLGLRPTEETDQDARYRVGQVEFIVFPSTGKASGDHTQMAFEVEDLQSAVTALRDKGVVFEEYDMPGFKSVGGIVDLEGDRGAWFKDSEGNLLAIAERTS
jgi:catechol 2,3-dioxygenase-like lactoylglutathione lyase family enzyme